VTRTQAIVAILLAFYVGAIAGRGDWMSLACLVTGFVITYAVPPIVFGRWRIRRLFQKKETK
jgi:type IV secretory pathway VirB2 component (pilin)